MKKGLSLIAAGIIFLGCGGGGGTSSSSPVVSGVVCDGYVKDAKVCIDLNKNGNCDDGEPFSYSDTNGKFSIYFDGNITSDILVSEGGVNVITGEKMDKLVGFEYKDANITPITTLGFFIDSNATIAKEKVKKLLGLNILDINVFADPQKSVFLLKPAVLINGVSKILMNKGFSFEDSYKRIIDYLENNTSLTDNVELDSLIEAVIDNIENVNEDSAEWEKDAYKAIEGIINNSSVYVPVGYVFNHKWYKYLSKYVGDKRFVNSKAYVLDDKIYLKTYKISQQETRGSVFSNDFSLGDLIKEDVNITATGDGAKFSMLASTPMDATTSNILPKLNSTSNLGVYGGVTLYKSSVCDFGGVYDGSNISEKEFVCKDLNVSLIGKNVQIVINSNGNGVFSYLVLDENKNSLYSDEVNMSREFNITKSSYLFSYTKSKVQIDSNAIVNESSAVITNFSISGPEDVDSFLKQLKFYK